MFSKPKIPFKKAPLALACLLATLATPAQAVDFNIGEIEGKFDSQLSIGASWRMEDRDPKLVGIGNGGEAASIAADDGNLNFDKGETFSQIFKGVHDLQLTYDNLGAFVRGKYWYDLELEDQNRPHGHIANGYASSEPLNDDDFSDFAKFSGAELLDAYIYGDFDLAEMPLDLRLGRQVVSWGESTFIQGGINSINPIDVSAFRRPGAAIKEGLLPVNMVFAGLGMTDNLSLEAFYQLEWEKTEIDGCGTYFSTADFAADGCNGITFAANLSDQANLAAGTVINRAGDGEPEDEGQFGVALRYYAEDLDAEFGLYYLNYHSRTPYINGIRTSSGGPHPALGGPAGFDGQYRIVFPEDIELYGLSLSTTLGSTAVSGEISYRPNLPIQINGPELLAALLSDGLAPSTGSSIVQDTAPGAEFEGFDRFDVTQAQLTAIQFIDQVLGASRLTLIGEVGATYVADLPKLSEQRYGRSPLFGRGDTAGAALDGYVTDFAWGYRLRANLDYNNVFAGINLKPSLAWSHDVNGFSPAPAQQFEEGRKAISVGLTADYLNRYSADISYTAFFDGDFNTLEDRDFIAASASISF